MEKEKLYCKEATLDKKIFKSPHYFIDLLLKWSSGDMRKLAVWYTYLFFSITSAVSVEVPKTSYLTVNIVL